MRHVHYLVAAILLDVAATLALRESLRHTAWIVVVVLGYAGAFGLLTVLMRLGEPLGILYAYWAATGVSLTAVLAAAIYGDPLTLEMVLGIALVIVGIFLVENGSRHAGRAPEERGRP